MFGYSLRNILMFLAILLVVVSIILRVTSGRYVMEFFLAGLVLYLIPRFFMKR